MVSAGDWPDLLTLSTTLQALPAFGPEIRDLEAAQAVRIAKEHRGVRASLHDPRDRMRFVYGSGGDPGTVEVKQALDGTRYVRLPLGCREFAILE